MEFCANLWEVLSDIKFRKMPETRELDMMLDVLKKASGSAYDFNKKSPLDTDSF